MPPPGLPFTTVIWAEPILAIKLAATLAESWVLLVEVVGNTVPFQLTIEVDMKLDPVTVKVKAPLPNNAL